MPRGAGGWMGAGVLALRRCHPTCCRTLGGDMGTPPGELRGHLHTRSPAAKSPPGGKSPAGTVLGLLASAVGVTERCQHGRPRVRSATGPVPVPVPSGGCAAPRRSAGPGVPGVAVLLGCTDGGVLRSEAARGPAWERTVAAPDEHAGGAGVLRCLLTPRGVVLSPRHRASQIGCYWVTGSRADPTLRPPTTTPSPQGQPQRDPAAPPNFIAAINNRTALPRRTEPEGAGRADPSPAGAGGKAGAIPFPRETPTR